MNFSEQIKQSNTDEWYTPKECVELIVKYLERGGGNIFYALLISQKAIL